MCKLLKITRSQYYKSINFKFIKTNNTILENTIIKIFNNSKKIYGSRKISKQLENHNIFASKFIVLKVMKKYDLNSRYHIRKYRKYSKSNFSKIPNVVKRNFELNQKKLIITSDLTYIKLNSKFYYVCFLININTRQIVGCSMSEKKDINIVLKAFENSKIDYSTIDIFHTDRGSEFVNLALDAFLHKNNIIRSLSKPGCPYDNAVSESTFNIFKREIEYDSKDSKITFEMKLIKYVDWYNNIRIHSTLKYLSPNDYAKFSL